MDKVQVYACFFFVLTTLMYLVPAVVKDKFHEFGIFLLAVLLWLPMMGRIFNWW